jgi:hypothetical protein
MKTNYSYMKRPCQSDFDTQEDDYSCMESSPETSSGQAIWQKLKIIII